MKTNTAVKKSPIYTHEGAKAFHLNHDLQLRRLVLSTMLFEDTFYVDGKTISESISEAAKNVSDQTLANLALEARTQQKLRHVPLFLLKELAKRKPAPGVLSNALTSVIQRADELGEFLSLYWDGQPGKKTLSSQVKKGLAKSFAKFDEYQLSKYNRDAKVKLRDVLFLTHAKPKDEAQAATWKKLVDGTLETADTWESRLSSGLEKKTAEQKKEHWEALLKEQKLGALALLRNLRNMQEANVSDTLIKDALFNINPERVLPFRFIAAARHAKRLEPQLETGMLKCLSVQDKLPGKTVLLVDVSGSMEFQVSGRSEISRLDAACGVAMLLREIADDVNVYTFSDNVVEVAPRRGFALRDAIVRSQSHGGTATRKAVDRVNIQEDYDRLIVITDEQANDGAGKPKAGNKGYMINVASYKNGIGYGAWNHIDGWSEAVIDYIREYEKTE